MVGEFLFKNAHAARQFYSAPIARKSKTILFRHATKKVKNYTKIVPPHLILQDHNGWGIVVNFCLKKNAHAVRQFYSVTISRKSKTILLRQANKKVKNNTKIVLPYHNGWGIVVNKILMLQDNSTASR
jgi:hypothetical protein